MKKYIVVLFLLSLNSSFLSAKRDFVIKEKYFIAWKKFVKKKEIQKKHDLLKAAKTGDVPTFKKLFLEERIGQWQTPQEKFENVRDWHGNNVLHLAVIFIQPQILDIILESGVDINVKTLNVFDYTPLKFGELLKDDFPEINELLEKLKKHKAHHGRLKKLELRDALDWVWENVVSPRCFAINSLRKKLQL